MSEVRVYYPKNQFRLIDPNGDILASPGDEILIAEPNKFQSTDITVKRDILTHGFDYEYTNEKEPLGFTRAMGFTAEQMDPYTFLSAIYDLRGTDAEVIFEFDRFNTVTQLFEIQYSANIDFGPESYSRKSVMITVNARRITLGDLFRTRKETPVDFNATTSIDGSSITGLSPDSMFLHSKNLLYTQKATSSPAESTVTTNNSTGWIVQFDFNQSSNFLQGDLSGFDNYLNVSFGGGAQSFLFNSPELIITPNYIFKDVFGFLEFDLTLNYNIVWDNNVLMTGTHLGTFINIDGVETSIDGGSGVHGPQILLDINVFRVITLQSFNIPKDARVSIYDKWTFTGLNNFDWNLSPGAAVGSDDEIDSTFTAITENSFADVYNTFDSFNHILEVITNGTNLFVSDFWSNIANEIYRTNGYKIRNFTDRELKTSFKDSFNEWAQPCFGLGYAVFNDSGTFKVLMERYSHFYQDVEIDYIEDIEDGSFELLPDKDVIFNELVIGYEDFSKSTDENKGNNVDAFNTKHSLLTSIEKVKNKKTYISKTIADGFKINKSRMEQFDELPRETVSDDDNIFVIKGTTSDTYTVFTETSPNVQSVIYFASENEISLNGTWFDIRVGDVIEIFAAPDANYTVNTITFEGRRMLLAVGSVTSSLSVFADRILTLPSARLRAERNEAFSTLNGVINPDTVYNVGLNPKYMLNNQSLIINSGLSKKAGTETIKVQDVKLNGEMECRFKAGQGGYNLDPGREVVKMNADVQLNDNNQNNKLWTGNLIKFVTKVDYSRFLGWKDKCLNQAVSENYGFLRVNIGGTDMAGWPMLLGHNPSSNKIMVLLREKA